MQDQSVRPHRSGTSDHPAIARLRAELDAARRGIDVLGELEDTRRERGVAELLTAVPDVASRAAREAGTVGAVETIRRFADTGVGAGEPTGALWERIVVTAVEAAAAVDAGVEDTGTPDSGAHDHRECATTV